jgi:hypothetical protein
VTRARLERELAAAEAQHVETLKREHYWRTRCERLTDAALAKQGAIDSPTFVEPKPPTASPSELLARAFATTEIDSREIPRVVAG